MDEKTFNNLLLILTSIIALQSCTSINYVGNIYPPTEKIQTYYSFDEIPIEHTIFGHIVSSSGSGDLFISVDDLQEKLENEAMSRGADAVVITGINIEHADDNRIKKVKASLVKFLQ